MCRNPVIVNGIPLWCRKCDECRDARISDWVGRCVAESRHATKSHSVTLTYGRDDTGNEDHLHAALLMYSDVQKLFKSLRKAGYKFKYLVAGEYGSRKRRAHWHILFFWLGKSPDMAMRENVPFEWWPHGHTFWEDMTARSVLYVCKYLQKEQSDEEGEAMLRMSKKPPLGHEWFQGWARQHVEMGLAPRSLHYGFDDVRRKNGKRREFYMRGVTADNFLTNYCKAFVAHNGHIRFPESELLTEWLDKKYADYFEVEAWIREKHNGKITETYKQSVLESEAEKHGGIRIFLPGVSRERPALALCKDNTILEYGRPETSIIDRFHEILDRKAGREISNTTTEGI